jgi:endonuclease-3
MKPAHVEELFRRLSERLPEPQTELEYRNPYTLLVAVVLSAQATDVSVNKATEPLFRIVEERYRPVAHPAGTVWR